MKQKLPKLPDIIKVKIKRSKSGIYLAKLPEYDIFTEADSRIELDFNINDLIYTFFDVPKQFQGKIIYRPIKYPRKEMSNITKVDLPVSFQQFLMSDLYRQNCYLQ